MRSNRTPADSTRPAVAPRPGWTRLLLIGSALLLLVGLVRVAQRVDPAGRNGAAGPAAAADSSDRGRHSREDDSHQRPQRTGVAPGPTAEETVAAKLALFSNSRRELARTMARRKGVPVPAEVERFFDALESGNWEEIDSQFKALGRRSGQYDGSTHSPELDPVWNAVLDAYGAAEQVHEWPAQQLLDYGHAILASLRPGMVYVGGTDSGRWIPELLNETSAGEHHVILTQNALADGRYVEYMSALYGDRFANLTQEDSKRAFEDYVADAGKRLEHDQQFPEEPRQIRNGEEVKRVDGKVVVGGHLAVMSINEKLLQAIMARNPELTFAVQESSPLPGTYSEALPLGPLMELRARDGSKGFTPERAAESLDYWRSTAQQLLADPEAAGSPTALKSYSHDTVSAAHLLEAHHFQAEAEETYRLSAQLWPGNPESVGGLANLLTQSGREAEASQLVESFTRNHPDQAKALERVRAATRLVGPAPAGGASRHP